MKTAHVEVPSADYGWFSELMKQNGWEWKFDPEERPDFVED
jgi:hypothetical protein